MQWNQIKTLFILCFLALNIYLLYLVIDKQKDADISVIERGEDATIEERLESEDIAYKEEELPHVEEEEPFLSVEQKIFDKKDAEALSDLRNQKSEILDSNMIVSIFEEPFKLPNDLTEESLSTLLQSEILYPEQYKFGSWDESMNVLVFFQEKNDRPIYFNHNGMVLLFLNDDNEATGYIQTMLGESEEGEEKKSLIQPIKAIETLYLSNQLNSGEEVTKMSIGYHTRVPLTDGIQVFVPTWKVSVDNEREHYINAIEGFVFSGNDYEFLYDVIETYTTYIRSASIEDEEIKEKISEQLNNRLEEDNRSEE